MAKDYKHVVNKKSDGIPSGIVNKIMPFITGLGFGLVITFIFYLSQQNGSWMPFQAKPNGIATVETAIQSPVTEQVGKTADIADEVSTIPPPKFDFYNILPNKELNISEWVAEEPPPQQPILQDANTVYILQVGSFKQLEAADQVKAQLALLGITADIQRVVINGQDAIYRVRVGPYAEQQKLNDARERLQENKLEFMLLKLQADDPRLGEGKE